MKTLSGFAKKMAILFVVLLPLMSFVPTQCMDYGKGLKEALNGLAGLTVLSGASFGVSKLFNYCAVENPELAKNFLAAASVSGNIGKIAAIPLMSVSAALVIVGLAKVFTKNSVLGYQLSRLAAVFAAVGLKMSHLAYEGGEKLLMRWQR